MRSQWIRRGVCKPCILVCLEVFHPISESFVVSNEVSPSEVEYAERRVGQVIAKISLMQVHRADPHWYHLQVRICAEIGLVVGVEIGYTTSFGVPQSKYAICAGPDERDFSCLRRPFTMPTSVTETRVILRVNTTSLTRSYPRKHIALIKQVQNHLKGNSAVVQVDCLLLTEAHLHLHLDPFPHLDLRSYLKPNPIMMSQGASQNRYHPSHRGNNNTTTLR
jgi:hypothetical protein